MKLPATSVKNKIKQIESLGELKVSDLVLYPSRKLTIFGYIQQQRPSFNPKILGSTIGIQQSSPDWPHVCSILSKVI